jgi:hypothetical protein
MKALILFSIYFLINPDANSAQICLENNLSKFSDILEIVKEIDTKAATDEQIKSAHCTKSTPFSDEEMKSWLEANQSSERFNKKINGISFEQESPENLEAFKFLTTIYDAIGDKDLRFKQDYSSKCQKVECAVKEIFGDTGLQLLFMQRKFGMNGSHLAKKPDVASPWRKDELDQVLLALSDFPEGLLPISKSYTLTHGNREIDSNGMTANAVINIFNPWNKFSIEEKRYAIFHEVGHVIGNLTSVDKSPAWLAHSQWESYTKTIQDVEIPLSKTSKPETIVSQYALTNEREDFAESVAGYRYNPAHLKKVNPTKYQFLKEIVFDDVEYINKEACLSPKRISRQLVKTSTEKLKGWKPSEDEYSQIAKSCSELAITKLSEMGTINLLEPEFSSCFDQAMQRFETTELTTLLKERHNHEFMAPLMRNIRLPISKKDKLIIVTKSANLLKDDIKIQLQKVVSEEKNCIHENNLNHIHTKFEEAKLGFLPLDAKDHLESIVRRTCGVKDHEARKKLIDSMFKP